MSFKNNLIALFFLMAAVLIIILPSEMQLIQNPIKVDPKLYVSKVSQNNPTRINIQSVSIDLPVTDSKVVNGYWELSDTTASYGMGSGKPGNPGNIVIFAHARQGLFYNLKDIKEGDIVVVSTKDKKFKYKVNKITSVYPTEVEVVKPTKTETLTLYTCSGFYDEKRLIVQALPVKE